MKVAVEGCCHGEIDKIYEILGKVEEEKGYKIDLLICCGDFQAVRNSEDLGCMAAPMKYRFMQSFYKYYSGEKKAPIFTIFIGGNHEASNYLWELSYGGWVAPNIYYLGNAGVVKYGGLRIAGLSGIYKPFDYDKNHFECPPYNPSTVRSAYHVRACDVFRLRQVSGHIDIGLSHDWPACIYDYGDKDLLLRLKPFFGEEMANKTLGSPPALDLLKRLQPTYWFSGHLHVKFAAVYRHAIVDGATSSVTEAKETGNDKLEDEAMESQTEEERNELENVEVKEESGGVKEELKVEEDKASSEETNNDDGETAASEKIEVQKEEGSTESEVVDEKEPTGSEIVAEKEPTESEIVAEKEPTESEIVAEKEPEATSIEDRTEIAVKVEKDSESSEGQTESQVSSSNIKGTPTDTDKAKATPSDSAAATAETGNTNVDMGKITKFLALDKVMPRKRFLQILDVDPSNPVDNDSPYHLEYDAEWLAILKCTEHLMKYREEKWSPPTDQERTSFTPTEDELLDIQQRFSKEGSDLTLNVPENFSLTVPAYVENEQVDYKAVAKARENPQTVQFCEKLGVDNPFNPTVFGIPEPAPPNPDAIDVDEEVHHCSDDAAAVNNNDGDCSSRPALVLPPPTNTQVAEVTVDSNDSNTCADSADTQADSADTQANSNSADTQADSAITQADSSNTQVDSSNTQADSSNTQADSADTQAADTTPCTDAGNCDVNPGNGNGESNESQDFPQSQNLKRSLSDRSPDRCVQPEESASKEDKSPSSENKVVGSQDDQPLIKRRNVALYNEEPVDD